MGKDYYKTLGIEKNASQDEIKKAFRKKAHQFHPDKQGGDEAKFKEVNEAYQVLGNEQKRAQYDKFGSSFENAQAGGGFSGFDGFRDFSGFSEGFNMDDIGDMFGGIGDIFGFGGNGRKTSRQRRGADIEANINIAFDEAVFGVEKEISLAKNVTCDKCSGDGAEPGSKIDTCKTCKGHGKVTRMQRTILGNIQTQSTCPDCSGEGKTVSKKCTKCRGEGRVRDTVKIKVKIPAGIDSGQAIRLSGQGEAGPKNSSAGDLYLRVAVLPDPRFRRDGFDIRSNFNLSFVQAALGDKVDIETVDGKVSLKIPEGTQTGNIFKLKGKGITKLNARGRGDHLVKVTVKTPTNLTRKQKKTLNDLGI